MNIRSLPPWRRSIALALAVGAAMLWVATIPGNAYSSVAGTRACPHAPIGYSECLVGTVPLPSRTPSAAVNKPNYEGTGVGGGFSPSDLRSAYKLPENGGSGQTVAIVDAFDDPHAEADLKEYREHYKLSACTTSNGCFKKVNETGGTTYPEASYGWSVEISIDLDMVSAICPECHILLVEAASNTDEHLYKAEAEALKLGATEISNSWGSEEYEGEESQNSFFDHPGVPTTFSSGDNGYKTEYPAASPYVIAVGGTKLVKEKNTREWSETVWSGSGSGCSGHEIKPSWQTDSSCSHRTDNDVAAVASSESPVSGYDSYVEKSPGWYLFYGTSVASPIVASTEALSTSYSRTLGAEAFYIAGPAKELFDVTSGSNGSCTPEYLCHGEVGYDGPTGWGAPDKNLTLKEGAWSGEGPANPTGSEDAGIASVSCKSSTFCMAVGDYYNASSVLFGYADEWNGTSWTVKSVPAPTGATETELSSVSCTSSSECTASGSYGNREGHRPALAERWNGTEWKLQTAANPTGSLQVELKGVDCAGSTSCYAVGSNLNNTGGFEPLAEVWNGTSWSLQTMSKPESSTNVDPVSISCTSGSACTAVGWYQSNTGVSGFAERWNGVTWSLQSTAKPSGEQAWLFGASCSSPIDCAAVGFSVSGTTYKTLAERWNGENWSIVKSANPTGTQPELDGISCSSYTDCTASGGYRTTSGEEQSLVERWNGSEWTIQTTPPPSGGKYPSFGGVSCLSSQACTAVGGYLNSSSLGVGLAEKYN